MSGYLLGHPVGLTLATSVVVGLPITLAYLFGQR